MKSQINWNNKIIEIQIIISIVRVSEHFSKMLLVLSGVFNTRILDTMNYTNQDYMHVNYTLNYSCLLYALPNSDRWLVNHCAMPSIGQTWVLASIGAVVEMGILSTLKLLPMESRLSTGKTSISLVYNAWGNLDQCIDSRVIRSLGSSTRAVFLSYYLRWRASQSGRSRKCDLPYVTNSTLLKKKNV
jgi:hypothetical protein